jgi:hypothetical protein
VPDRDGEINQGGHGGVSPNRRLVTEARSDYKEKTAPLSKAWARPPSKKSSQTSLGGNNGRECL